MKQGRFAASAMSTDSHKFASINGKIDTAKGFDSSLVVALVQATHFENGTSHGVAPPPVRGARRARRGSLRQPIQPKLQFRVLPAKATRERMPRRCSRFPAEPQAGAEPPIRRGCREVLRRDQAQPPRAG